jgi:hypothetical protein
MKMFREGNIHIITGTAIALFGVATARLIAPELIGITNKMVLILGYVLSLMGIVIVAHGARS